MLKVEETKDKVRVNGIKAKMEQEGNKKMWYFINRSQKDPYSSAPHFVQKMVGDKVVTSTTQEETEEFIFREISFDFNWQQTRLS